MDHHPFEQMSAKDTRYSAPLLAVFPGDILPCRVELSRRRRLQWKQVAGKVTIPRGECKVSRLLSANFFGHGASWVTELMI